MRRPSENLMRLLTQLRLATERDIAACEPVVKQLCQNLPEFDSVWIDALVQRRILTPWQASQLTSADPESLRVGDYLKTEQLGTKTFHACSANSGRHVVLQLLPQQHSDEQHVSDSLKRKLKQLDEVRSTAPSSLELPRGVLAGDAEYLVSGYVQGWTADELLIRGGRIPWQVVAEIGRQLLEALTWLEEQESVHGEVSLRNIKLRPSGNAVLVSAFNNSAASQGISLTADMRLSDIETMAPERVGSGIAESSCSELYSVGCVLWQLLTARPTFLPADPVNKVLKSQQTDVADVRNLVPDCPDWMARLLQNMTRRSPDLRPKSIAATNAKWQQHANPGTQQTRRLVKRLPDHSRRKVRPGTSKASVRERMAAVSVASIMIAGFAWYGIQSGLLPAPLAVSGSNVKAGSTISSTAEADLNASAPPLESERADGLLSMPRPDAAGVVVLQSGMSYVAGDLQFAGTMHIETTADAMAIVQVPKGQLWKITANQIGLRNVDVRRSQRHSLSAESTGNGKSTAVECHCDVLSVETCRIDAGREGHHNRGLSWTPRAGVTSVVSISNSVLYGGGYGLCLKSTPQRCDLSNLLFRTTRSAVRCEIGSESSHRIAIKVNQVTQVEGLTFLDAVVLDAAKESLSIQMTCGESVMAVSTGLIQIAAPPDWPLENTKVECLLPERGNPTILPPGVRTAIGFDSSLNSIVGLQDFQVRAEAILIATPVFRGAAQDRTTPDAGCELLDYEGPKLSQQLPGANLARLPLNY